MTNHLVQHRHVRRSKILQRWTERRVATRAGVNTDYSNLAPRLGFAATLPHAIVLRGGWGLAFFPGNYMSQSLMKNPPFVGTYGPVTSTGASGLVPNLRLSDGLPLPTPTDAVNPSGTIIGVAQDFKNTRIQQFNLIAEKEFGGNVFSAGYVGSRGAHVAFVVPNLNLAPAAPRCHPAAAHLLRATPRRDDDRHVCERLRVDLQRSAAGVSAAAPQWPDGRLDYVLAHTQWTQPSPNDVNVIERFDADFDIRHKIVFTANYELPFGESLTGAAKQLLAGWQVNGVASWQTGLPFNVTNSTARANTSASNDWPNLVGDPELSNPTVDQWFNTAAFAAQTINTIGNGPRNVLHGPPQRRLDLSLFKDFGLTGAAKLQLRSSATTSPTRRASRTRRRRSERRASARSRASATQSRGRCSLRSSCCSRNGWCSRMTKARAGMRGAVIAASLVVVQTTSGADSAPGAYDGWPAYGGGPDQIRYSTLAQINRSNVRQLEVAWTYNSARIRRPPDQSDCCRRRVVHDDPEASRRRARCGHRRSALDVRFGHRRTRSEPGRHLLGERRRPPHLHRPGSVRLRAPCRHRTAHRRLRPRRPDRSPRRPRPRSVGAVCDADDAGRRLQGFVHRRRPGQRGVTGFAGRRSRVRRAHRRAALEFSYDSAPWELGYDSWPADAWTYTGGVNNWAGMAVDEARGIVYVPTGSASADFYGANRLGDNLFANSLIALDAATGRRLWHFQAVHHDIWDRDFPSPPSLVTVTQNGRRIDAVAQTTKHGFVFLFDRVLRHSAVSDRVSRYSRRAPLTASGRRRRSRCRPRPAPFARQRLTEQMLTTRTPEAHRAAARSIP